MYLVKKVVENKDLKNAFLIVRVTKEEKERLFKQSRGNISRMVRLILGLDNHPGIDSYIAEEE